MNIGRIDICDMNCICAVIKLTRKIDVSKIWCKLYTINNGRMASCDLNFICVVIQLTWKLDNQNVTKIVYLVHSFRT